MLIPALFSPGAFGKIPTHGDFVRVNAGDAAGQQLATWLQEGVYAVTRSGSALPSTPTSFLWSTPMARNVLVGAFMASRDRVGRAFPLAVFLPVEAQPLANDFPLVPVAFNGFLSAAAALLESAATISVASLQQRVRELPIPEVSDWSFADDQRRLQLGKNSTTLLEPFSEPEMGGAPYALRTFSMACKAEKSEPTKARVVLDCPLPQASPVLWLDFAARLLTWKVQPPSFLWTEAVPQRLLLALGPVPPTALGYLARPDSSLAIFWPLTTNQKSALDGARLALSENQQRILDDSGSSIATLFSAFAV